MLTGMFFYQQLKLFTDSRIVGHKTINSGKKKKPGSATSGRNAITHLLLNVAVKNRVAEPCGLFV